MSVREEFDGGVLVSVGDHERLQSPLCVAKISNDGVLLLSCYQGQNDWEQCRPLQTKHVSIMSSADHFKEVSRDFLNLIVIEMKSRNGNIYEYQLSGARLEEDGEGVSNARDTVRQRDKDYIVLPDG
jgi:hypothetical protein